MRVRGRSVLRWGLVLVACAVAAGLMARWWTVRAEERFQARLRSAPTAELQKLARQREWDPEVFYWLGARLTADGQHVEAAQALLRSVALRPHSAPSRAALGLALARLDRPRDAEEQLQEAVALDPKLQFAYFALGNLYGKHQRWEKAAAALTKAVALNPDDLEAQYLLAQCYGELFQEDRKMQILERLVQRAPNNIEYLKSLGYVYLFYGKFAQAEATYRRILAIAPNELETRYLLGRALAEQANTPEAFITAERELRHVATKVPDNPGVRLALGILHFRRNEPRKAIPELERAIKHGVREHKTWLYLGQAYQRVGRVEDAKRTLDQFQRGARISRTVSQLENRLLNLPEDTPENRRERITLRLRLVRVYLDDNNLQRALNHLRILQEQDKSNPEAQKLTREYQERLQKAEAAAGQRPRTAAAGQARPPDQ